MFLKSIEGNGNQGTEHPPNKDRTRYQCLELQSPKTQMPRRQFKNTIISCYPESQHRRTAPRSPELTNLAFIPAQIQHFESVYPNVHTIYKLLEYMEELVCH